MQQTTKAQTEAQILHMLRTAREEMNIEQIASQLGIARHTAAKYLEILKAKGQVRFRKLGNAKLWRATVLEASTRPTFPREARAQTRTMTMALPTVEERLYRDPFCELHPPLTDPEARIEASRCLECGGPYAPAPCTVACPTHIDIPRFIREIRDGTPLDAARTIFADNLLGATCARVCPVEVLCQGACVLHEEGRRAVEIGLLQRYAADWALERHEPVLPPKVNGVRSGRVAVLGAGPASLACAAELARLGYPVTLFEGKALPGGLVTHAIAPYKQLIDPLPREVEEIKKLGIELRTGVAVGRDLPLGELDAEYDAIFLGIGLGEDQSAGVPGEDLEGIYDSLEFIERLKLGDWQQLQRHLGDRVAVIGGGNTAIDVAREAVRLGAKDVTVLYRRTEKDMPAYRHEYEEARREGVHFLWLTAPERFLGNGRVYAVKCVHLRMVEPEAGRRSPLEPVPGTEFTLEVDSVIQAIGQRKRTEFLQQIRGLELDHGLVRVDEWGRTTAQKYFAGGDCVNGGDTVVRAVAEGKRAAQGIHRYMSGGEASS